MATSEDARLTEACALLVQRGVKAYLVGGCVRDALLHRPTKDWDVAVADNALDIARWLADILGGAYVPLDADRGVARVVFSGEEDQWHLDLTSFDGDIESDLGRRDFTIDAMAAALVPRTKATDSAVYPHICASDIIDPFGGLRDLTERRIKVVSKDVFQEDPLRLLRAVRLAAEHGFVIDQQTEDLMKLHAALLSQVSPERIREEIVRILRVPTSTPHLYYLDQVGLLTVVFPEISPMKGVEQPKEHYWDVFHHSMETVAGVERLLSLDESLLSYAPWLRDVVSEMDKEVGDLKRSVLLKIAALLHDVAKPQTKSLQEDGRTRFFGHPQEGADIAANLLHRLRFSSRQTKGIECMIQNHLRLWQMSHNDMPTRHAIYRYFRDTGDVALDIIVLTLADFLATQGPRLDLAEWEAHAHLMGYILAEYQRDESISRPPKLISGDDLISLFGMQPGPEIGRVLEAVREAQGMGEITAREEALAFARRLIIERNYNKCG